MLLQVENLSFRYDARVRPIEGVGFAIEAGRHSLLLGPSGSGKTTLIYLIAGLLTPASGRILLDGVNLAALGQAARDRLRRRNVGLVFQTLRLVSALSLRANLRLAMKLSGAAPDPKAIDALLARLGLSARAAAMPHELSQGEAQRAAIARAIIAKPRLLITDEPTSALDDANVAIVADLLQEMADAEGATLLIATHDLRLKGRFPAAVTLRAQE